MGDRTSASLKEFYIPDYIINSDSEIEKVSEFPEYPIVVFVNSKSGGQLGGHLLETYRTLLNKNQVVNVMEEAPQIFLSKLYQNLEVLKQKGDELAFKIEEKLKIIVAGGDGTDGWILGVVYDLNLPRMPPIATVPLGTGNNLPYAFGWGKWNPGTDAHSVKSFLQQVKNAKEMKVDNWHILMRMKVPQKKYYDPVAPLELPHSLHAFKRSTSQEDNMDGFLTFRGGFWNYFSMGMDAQVSYAFDSERKLHPEKFKNQLANQKARATIGCRQGWLFASLSHPADNIINLAKVKIMKKQGDWEELQIPNSIRAIVCLNLPSFSGGFNPWGKPNKNKPQYKDFTTPCVDDGLLEVVGFTDAWQFLSLMAPNGHGTRLAQAHRIRFEFHKGGADHTYMRIDGEPWKQPLPVDDDTFVVEISHHGQANMLVTNDCRSKSIHDPANHDESFEGDIEDEAVAEGEEWRKFGSAETFQIPDEVYLSQLS